MRSEASVTGTRSTTTRSGRRNARCCVCSAGGITMAQNARLSSHHDGSYYDEQAVESLDEPAGGPEFMAYGSTPSMAKRDYFLPEDIPLFLSNDAAEPRQRGFGSGGARGFDIAA